MKYRHTLASALCAAALIACGGGGNDGGGGTSAPAANIAPVAAAGAEQNVITGALVTLDGSTSSDADKDALTYKWTLTSRPISSAATLTSPTSAKPTFTADVTGAYTATLVVNDGKIDSPTSTVTITASAANAAPIANAGPAQNVVAGAVVTLDGSVSSDANGDSLTYAWALTSKPAGSAATLTAATSVKPAFTADVAGSYVATLIVNDGKIDSPTSTVTITASAANAAPIANAGPTQNVVAGAVVTLDGSVSSDANGDSLTYAWTLTSKPAGSAATLTAATSVKPTFTADVAGTYVATLIVNDGKLNSASTTVAISASAANAAPIANAGPAQNVVAGAVVTLDGSVSSDANGDSLTYAWALTSKPAGSAATLTAATSVKPTFTADVAGTYVATLIVNDGKLNSAASTVAITVNKANAAPVANAGTAQNVVAGTTVTLDGSASSDANGDALAYKWTLTAAPAGSAAVLIAPTTSKPSFTADIAGTYVATLTVNDGQLDSAATNVTVTASVANAAPVANAGTPQTVVAGSVVTLDGSASTDANNDALTYQWTLTTKPVGSVAVLSTPTIAKPSFTADLAGDYVATLTVDDGKVRSAPATVTLKATPLISVSLLSVSDSLFGGGDSLQSWPYSLASSVQASANCVGASCPPVYDVATFKLRASGQNFTIANLAAINLTSGSTITPLFSGLSNGQTITDGQTVTFKLQSPFTKGSTVNLNYRFTIKETGETFNYTVQLKTN